MLKKLLLANGELLPLIGDIDGPLWLFNPQVLAALDEERSEIVRFEGSDDIMDVERIVLRREVVGEAELFRARGYFELFAGSNFVREVEARGLMGLRFKPVEMSG